MAGNSFIYRNIGIYRLLMGLLYKGRYYRRYAAVCRLIEGKKVTELCFGDTVIAAHCRENGIEWTGYDINPGFIKRAAGKGFHVVPCDIKMMKEFASADVCIICGSLYHFHEELPALFAKMLGCAPVILLSEPVINLSAGKGIIGKLARASAGVNGQRQEFRYTEETLTAALEALKQQSGFSYSIEGRVAKDIIIRIRKHA